MSIEHTKIGFIGTGRMATALAAGFTRDLVRASQIFGADPVAASRDMFRRTVGDAVTLSETANECLSQADVVFLAVKPQMMQ